MILHRLISPEIKYLVLEWLGNQTKYAKHCFEFSVIKNKTRKFIYLYFQITATCIMDQLQYGLKIVEKMRSFLISERN